MAQRTVSSGGVTATLWAVVEEIDDDDEDILEVTIDVANESAWDLWDINGDIRAMDGTHAHSRGAPSRIESGEDDELKFWVPSDTGAWLFKIDYNTDSGSGSVELGPFTNEVRIAATTRPERIANPSTSSPKMGQSVNTDPMAAAFGTAFAGFGDDEAVDNTALEADISSEDPMQAAFAGGLLSSQQVPPAPPHIEAPTAPPAAPLAPLASPAPPAAPSPEQFTQPPGPPTGPPPSSPPSGPSGKPPGPPPSGSPPGPPPKSAKPPGPPPS